MTAVARADETKWALNGSFTEDARENARRVTPAQESARLYKRTRLQAHGWRVGSAADFLELTPEEAAFVETKLALSQCLRNRRVAQKMSQATLAKRLKSSQSRIAMMEAADVTVYRSAASRTLCSGRQAP